MNRLRIHQPSSRMFFVFFSMICKFECNTTSDWLNLCIVVGLIGPWTRRLLKTLWEKEKMLVTLYKKAFENIVGKGENAGNHGQDGF